MLRGERFEHSVPVEVLTEFAAYRDLIFEVAKHLFLANHRSRKRLPKGFEDRFQLQMTGLTNGSPQTARVELSRVRQPTGASEPLPMLAPDEFEAARDLVAHCVATFVRTGRVPSQFPQELLPIFNSFGQRLRDGEALELRGPGATESGPAYTPEVRKNLVLSSSNTYLLQVDLTGVVTALDRERRRFSIKPDGLNVGIDAPFPKKEYKAIHRALGDASKYHARIIGVGKYDKSDRLKKIVSVSRVEIVQVETEDQKRWRVFLAGLGDALPAKHADRVRSAWGQIQGALSNDAPIPFATLTDEGALQLAWNTDEYYLEINLHEMGLSWFFKNHSEDKVLGTDDDVFLDEVPREALDKIITIRGLFVSKMYLSLAARVLRTVKKKPGNTEFLPTEGIRYPVPAMFNPSSGDKKEAELRSLPIRVSVWDSSKTTVREAKALTRSDTRPSLEQLAFSLNVSDVDAIKQRLGREALCVVEDPLEPPRDEDGAEGHCGIEGLDRRNGEQGKEHLKVLIAVARACIEINDDE